MWNKISNFQACQAWYNQEILLGQFSLLCCTSSPALQHDVLEHPKFHRIFYYVSTYFSSYRFGLNTCWNSFLVLRTGFLKRRFLRYFGCKSAPILMTVVTCSKYRFASFILFSPKNIFLRVPPQMGLLWSLTSSILDYLFTTLSSLIDFISVVVLAVSISPSASHCQNQRQEENFFYL